MSGGSSVGHTAQNDAESTAEKVPAPGSSATRYLFSRSELRAVLDETGTSKEDLGEYLRLNRGYGSSSQVDKWLSGELALTQDAIEHFPPKMRIRWAERALDRARESLSAAPLPPAPIDSTLHEGAEALVAALKLHDKFMKDPVTPGRLDEREARQMNRALAKCRGPIDRASRDLSVFAMEAVRMAGGGR